MTGPEFTSEQLYERAQGNVTAFVLCTIAFFKEQHRPVEEWVTYIGNRFASSWEQVKGQGANVALEQIVLNFVSSGGNLRSFSGDESRAEAVVTDWPPSDFLEMIGLAPEDIDPFYAIFNPIASYLNLHYTWHREGSLVSFTVTR
jgi:hypothetical protein